MWASRVMDEETVHVHPVGDLSDGSLDRWRIL
jgi:hypothetical protein